MKTKYISIEGVDSVGKETQAKLLKDALLAKDLAPLVSMYSFPDYDSLAGQVIREYLDGRYGHALNIHPDLASSLYMLDRVKAKDSFKADEQIPGSAVILDRYVHSNCAFQGSKFDDRTDRVNFYHRCELLEFKEYKLPEPDIILFLDASPVVAQELMGTRNGQKKDQHESNLPFLELAYKNYKEVQRSSIMKDRWVTIHCIENGKMRSIESIHEEILKVVTERLFIS